MADGGDFPAERAAARPSDQKPRGHRFSHLFPPTPNTSAPLLNAVQTPAQDLSTPSHLPTFTLPLRSESKKHTPVAPRSEATSKERFRKIRHLAITRISKSKEDENGEELFKTHFADSQLPSKRIRTNTEGVAVVDISGREFALRGNVIDLETDEASVRWKSAWLSRRDLKSARVELKAFKQKQTQKERQKEKEQEIKRLAAIRELRPQETPPNDAFQPKKDAAYNVWLRERLQGHAGRTPRMTEILSLPDARDLVFSEAFVDKATKFDVWDIRDRSAGMIYATGAEQNVPCTKCAEAFAKGSSPLPKCVVRSDVSNGACACCIMGGKNEACSLHSASKADIRSRAPQKGHLPHINAYTPLLASVDGDQGAEEGGHHNHANEKVDVLVRKRKRDLSGADLPFLTRKRPSEPPAPNEAQTKARSRKAIPVYPPGWRHPGCGAYPNPCTKKGRAIQLPATDTIWATIDRSKTFRQGEATAAQVRFIMSRASCRKLEVIHEVWKRTSAQGMLPAGRLAKEDFVRFLLTDMLNEMVADFYPEIIEVDD